MNLALPHQARLNGLLWMVLGTAGVLAALVVMNDYLETPRPPTHRLATPLEVAPPPPAPKPAARPRPRPKPKPRSAPPPPLLQLGTGLSGIDVGFGAVDPGDLEGADADLLGNADDVVMTADTVDVPPRPVRRAPLVYPPEARAKGITGEVVLDLLVEADGHVSQVKVASARPPGVFDEAAVRAVRQWRFQPARYQGRPVRVWARQRIRFQLG